MPAKDLGNKFICFKCGTKFYDLKKPEPLCPKCGADQRESPALKPAEKRRAARPAAPAPAAAAAVVEEAEAEDTEEADDEAEAADDEDEP